MTIICQLKKIIERRDKLFPLFFKKDSKIIKFQMVKTHFDY